MDREELCWGVDIGGTKIEGVVVSPDRPDQPRARLRIPTEQEQGYGHLLSQVETLVNELARAVGERPSVIGVGTPGTIDPERGTLKNSNTLCLNGQPVLKDLAVCLRAEVRVSNDANCFALAEALWGAGKGAECVFGVILGTGVGGGVVFRDAVWSGAQGNAGEWGHNVLDAFGTACYCGKSGCVETLISGPALEAWYAAKSGCSLTMAEIAANQEHDVVAKETIGRLCTYFGQAIATVINILDPQVIVLGGGVSKIEALYETWKTYARKHVFNDRLDTRVVPHALGDSAGVFGAAALCI
jgi:predicted NBD/HSP70 family sugar kinase